MLLEFDLDLIKSIKHSNLLKEGYCGQAYGYRKVHKGFTVQLEVRLNLMKPGGGHAGI